MLDRILTPDDFMPHQIEAMTASEHQNYMMLWHDMGSGKTATTLTIALERRDKLQVYGTLVIAPLRVCQLVWRQETDKWSHLQNQFKFSFITGTPVQRHRAMRRKADIYLVNFEMVEWLIDELIATYLQKGKYLPFNMLVVDEVSRFKDPGSNRSIAIQKILPWIAYSMGLTGTPAGTGYQSLFGQYRVIDKGERLGLDEGPFLEDYFTSGDAYTKKLKDGAKEQIRSLIADITYEYEPERDPETLPLILDKYITLPDDMQKKYNEFEKEFFLEVDRAGGGLTLEDDPETIDIQVFSAVALSMKCRQFANGAMFIQPDSPDWVAIHDHKLKALDEAVEEAAGKPVMVVYQFHHDRERIKKRYKNAVHFGGSLDEHQAGQIMADWQAGKIPMLLCHARSVGYGTDGLQHGGHIQIWFGLTWSLDDYLQTVRRLDRTGQAHRVNIIRILVSNTVEDIMVGRLTHRGEEQEDLKKSINAYRLRKLAA